MIVLFTDTDTDITPVEAKHYGYHLISMPYVINDKEIYPYEDYEVFDSHEFYEILRTGYIPRTSTISPLKYIDYFEPHFKNGDDILYVHFSKAMSGTFNAMTLAINDLKVKYPDRKLYTIDTKAITIGSLNIIKSIGDLHLEGKSIEEIIDWADKNVDKYATYFYADDLKFFQKSGRVSGFSAVMGNILGIRPIIFIGSDGQMKNIGKEIGKKQTLRRLVSYVRELGENIKDHRIIIGHTDVLDNALELKQMLIDEFGEDLQIELVVVNPTAGCHCGPSGVGVSFYAKHR